MEHARKLLNSHAQFEIFLVESNTRRINEREFLFVANIRRQVRNVSTVMTGREVDVFTLRVLCVQVEHGAQLKVGILFPLAGINKVEKALWPIEAGDKGSHGALLRANES